MPWLRNRLAGSVVLFGVVLLVAACGKGGVDLRAGGTELAFKLRAPASTGAGELDGAMLQTRRIVAARLAALNTPATLVIEGTTLRVRLPKSVDAARLAEVKALLAVQGRVEIREIDDGAALRALSSSLPADGDAEVIQDTWQHAGSRYGNFVLVAAGEEAGRKAVAAAPAFKLPDGAALLADEPSPKGSVRLYVAKAAVLDNASIHQVSAPYDAYLPPEVALQFNAKGAREYQEFTRRILGRKFAIVVDGRIKQTEIVQAPVASGRASIAMADGGDRIARQRAANLLAAILRAEMLPYPLDLEEERAIAPSR